jgi:hypothetical protein
MRCWRFRERRRQTRLLELLGLLSVSALAQSKEPDMERKDSSRKKLVLAGAPDAPEAGDVWVRDRPSDLKDASDMLRQQMDVSKRAADYADANAGDFEEE